MPAAYLPEILPHIHHSPVRVQHLAADPRLPEVPEQYAARCDHHPRFQPKWVRKHAVAVRQAAAHHDKLHA